MQPSDDIAHFEDWLAEVEPRALSLLERRVFSDGPRPTLEEIGEEWGVTRERVRQIEAKTLKSIDRVFGGALASAASPLRKAAGFVLPLERFQLVTDLIASGATRPTTIAAVLRHYSGPWVVDETWIHHESLSDRLQEARSAVAASTDENGLLSDDAPSRLDGLFACEEDQLLYFRTALGVIQLSGQWSTRDSLRARVVAALRHLGRPATKSEIAEAAG